MLLLSCQPPPSSASSTNYSQSEISVLYGSQTGNAESIAEALYGALKASHGHQSLTLSTLNAAKARHLNGSTHIYIIVCSTTGNADPPENAEAWYRSVKLRSNAKDAFKSVHYAVLGLGDTNYDKFCFVGKFIDKRLEELGGKRFLPVHCADEAINMEDVVSSFTKQVTKLLADIVLRASSAVEAPPVTLQDTSSSPLTPAIVAVTPAQNDLSKTLSNVEALPVFASPVIIPVAEEVAATPVSDDRNKADPAAAATPLLPSPSPPSALPDGVQDLPTLAKVLNLIVELSLAPLANQLPPLRHSGKAICQLLPPATPSPVNGDDVASKEWSAVHPYHATVKTARWLANSSSESNATSDDEDARQVLFLELDLGQSGITYSPGDSIGVCCPNPETLVELTLQRLSLAEDSDLSLDSMVLSGAEEGQVISLGELLRFRLDLVSIPKKACVLALAHCCRDDVERNQMLWLCAKDSAGKALWTSFIEEQGLGIGEILALFPSCAPTLAILSANAITLAPRLYSIACSQLRHPCSLSIAFSLVRYTCRVKSGREMASGKSIRRNGLCTHYLKDILFPLLTKDTSMLPTPKVRIFPKASLDFHLPGNTSFPLVLIGPGTGVAPFIGFLEHREQLLVERSREGEEVSAGLWRGAFEFEARDLPAEHSRVNDFLLQSTPGFTYLFYGCRNDADFLFRPELEGFLSSKALGCLSVAMSRVDKDKKVYVTHKIRDAGEELTKAILHENAYVFICGDGNSMAKDVNLALQESLMKWGELSESEAVSLLADLKAKKRYVLDVWS